MGRSFVGVILLGTLCAASSGCRAATTNTVVARAVAPDGRRVAVLLDRYYHLARVSDEFFVIIVPDASGVDAAIKRPHIGDDAAFVATNAGKVRVQWVRRDTLVVTCEACGLQSIDVMKRVDHLGSVTVLHRGVPPAVP
jgi:hypothetical protein